MIRDRLLAVLLMSAAGAASAGAVRYDFQDFYGRILAPASVPAHLQASPVSLSGAGICWNTSPGGTNDFVCGGFGIYSSLDGFSNALIRGILVGQVTGQRYDYDAGLVATGLGGPLELRLVSTGRDAGQMSAWLLDNLHLEVAVRPVNDVAEPGSLTLAAVALSGLLASARRWVPGRGGARA